MKEGLWVVPCLAPLAWWPSSGFPDRQQHWKEVLLNWGDLGTWDSISLWSSAHANQLCNSNFFSMYASFFVFIFASPFCFSGRFISPCPVVAHYWHVPYLEPSGTLTAETELWPCLTAAHPSSVCLKRQVWPLRLISYTCASCRNCKNLCCFASL